MTPLLPVSNPEKIHGDPRPNVCRLLEWTSSIPGLTMLSLHESTHRERCAQTQTLVHTQMLVHTQRNVHTYKHVHTDARTPTAECTHRCLYTYKTLIHTQVLVHT